MSLTLGVSWSSQVNWVSGLWALIWRAEPSNPGVYILWSSGYQRQQCLYFFLEPSQTRLLRIAESSHSSGNQKSKTEVLAGLVSPGVLEGPSVLWHSPGLWWSPSSLACQLNSASMFSRYLIFTLLLSHKTAVPGHIRPLLFCVTLY